MGIVDTLRSRGSALAEDAVRRVFADEARAQRIAQVVAKVQEGQRVVAEVQERLWQSVGLVSSGELRSAGKRLAQLRRTARALDEKLDALQKRVEARGG
ncbi:MAG: StkC protein [Pseudomonadota bacterium]|jgi:hypothetical protein